MDELQFRELAERVAALETKQDSMAEDMKAMRRGVETLALLASKGQGSLHTLLWVGGAITAFVALIGSVAGVGIALKGQ